MKTDEFGKRSEEWIMIGEEGRRKVEEEGDIEDERKQKRGVGEVVKFRWKRNKKVKEKKRKRIAREK